MTRNDERIATKCNNDVRTSFNLQAQQLFWSFVIIVACLHSHKGRGKKRHVHHTFSSALDRSLVLLLIDCRISLLMEESATNCPSYYQMIPNAANIATNPRGTKSF